MAIEEIRIKVSSDNKGILETIAKLKELGLINDKQVKAFLDANEKQKKGFKDLGTAAGGAANHIEQQFQHLGQQIMGYLALDKLIDFLKDATHEFIEAEKNAARLGFAIETIGNQSSAATKKLIEQSEQLQDSSIFSDDSIQQAQTALATYGLTAEQIEKLIPQILDLASASGTDLGTATDKVIQGINGQTRGLKELGISYKATGDATENLAILTDKLTKFQGASADATLTTAGKQEILNNKWGDFKESVGEFLVKGATEFLNFWDILIGDLTLAEYGLQNIRKEVAEVANIKVGERLESLIDKDESEKIKTLYADIVEFQLKYQQVQKDFEKGLISEDTRRKNSELWNAMITETQTAINRLNEEEISLGCLPGFVKNAQGECVPDTGSVDKLKDLTDQINAVKEAMYQTQLNMQRNALKQQALTDKKAAEETITDIVERNQTILAIDNKLQDDLYKLDEAAINRKADQDIERAKKEHASQLQINELVVAINEKRITDLTALDQQYADQRLKTEQDNWELMKAQLDVELEDLIAAHEKKEKELQALEEERFRETQELRIARTKEGSRKRLEAEIANAKENMAKELEPLDALHEAGLIAEEDYQRKRELIILKYTNEIRDKEKELWERQIKDIAEMIDIMADAVFERINQIIQNNINLIDRQQDIVRGDIEHQRRLAEEGAANTLAEAEIQYAELERLRIIQQEKMQKAKELEILLNSIIKYTEQDPNTAIAKAIAQMALVKGVEALYMEKGGIIGETSDRSMIGSGFSRLHPGGGDVLVHAQSGEGMLSREEMSNLGRSGFFELKAMLSRPLREKKIPLAAVVAQSGGIGKEEMAQGFNMVVDAIRNKKETHFDVDKFGNFVVTTVENGMAEVVTHMTKQPRL